MTFFKRGFVLLIATRMFACAFKRFLDFVLIDKRVLNPDSHRYVIANGACTGSAHSHCLGNMTVAEHQYSSKVLLSNCISRARFWRSSIRSSFFSSPSSDILSTLMENGLKINFSEASSFHTPKYLSNVIESTSK